MTALPTARQSVTGNFNATATDGSTAVVNIYSAMPVPQFRWRRPWDFGPLLRSKLHGFKGREWLFHIFERWLLEGNDRALLMQADYGVGKSAFTAALIRRNPHDAIVAHHFCQGGTNETLNPAQFVWGIASQLASAIPAYAESINLDQDLQQALDRAHEDAASAFERAVLGPLGRLEAPADGYKCIVIDALDESLEFDNFQGEQKTHHIVELLASRAELLPEWLKIFATTRNTRDVTGALSGAFEIKIINAEDQHNLDDLSAYIRERSSMEIINQRLAVEQRLQGALVSEIVGKSGGKFLYAALVLDELARGQLSIIDMPNLPQGMDGFYQNSFERRFAKKQQEYSLSGAILGLLVVAQEPLCRSDLIAALECPEEEAKRALSGLSDFLAGSKQCYALEHHSLAEWLTTDDAQGNPRAGRYHVSVHDARMRMLAWCQREVVQGTVTGRDYLVRHIAAHLSPSHLTDAYLKLLIDAHWLVRKLELSDVDTLLNEFKFAPHIAPLTVIELSLRQSSHILRRTLREDGNQIPGQLLARLLHRSEDSIRKLCADLTSIARSFGKPWLRPLTASLQASDALLGTLEGPYRTLVVLTDGRLAAGEGRNIGLWNVSTGKIEAEFSSQGRNVTALLALPNCRLAAGYHDGSIDLWNIASGTVDITLKEHTARVTALATLPNGRLASACGHSISIWNLCTGQLDARLISHTDWVTDLKLLPDGSLASSSQDKTIRVWNLSDRQVRRTLLAHDDWVAALAVLPDGRLASASWDCTIKLWNTASGRVDATLEGHTGWVTALASLPDGTLVSGSDDRTIKLWNPDDQHAFATLDAHEDAVTVFAQLLDGRLASGSEDRTLKLWNLTFRRPEMEPREGHTQWVTALSVMPDGKVASCSADNTVKLWDPMTGRFQSSVACDGRSFTAMTALSDGRLAFGTRDGLIFLWNVAQEKLDSELIGHASAITGLIALPGHRLVSKAGDAVIVWNLIDGQVQAKHETVGAYAESIALLRDGRLALGMSVGIVKIWNPLSGEIETAFDGKTNKLLSLSNGTLALADYDKIELRNVDDGQVRAMHEGGHTSHVTGLVEVTGGRLASASMDHTVVVWNTGVSPFVKSATFETDAGVSCLSVSSDFGTIVAGDSTGRVHFLKVEEV
jgi:WD40 repeat protein